jgi:ABC-type Mn2+/Zn2+ transport system permease subunit
VGSIVALGVKFVGTLLMGALVIIPAVTAKNLSKNLTTYSLLSALFGIVSAVIGSFIAGAFALSTGPVVVLVSICFFLLSYFLKQ